MFCKRDHGCSCALYSLYVPKMNSTVFKTRNYSEIKILFAKFIWQKKLALTKHGALCNYLVQRKTLL